MSLSSKTQDRYSAQILVNASNPQLSTSTSLDTTRFNAAIADVEGEFLKRGITYDDDDKRHVATAVPGVFARLLIMTAQGGREDWSEFKEDVKFLAETTTRDRITPYTNSPLDPTADQTGGLPFGDNTNFNRYTPSNDSDNPSGQD